MLTCSRTACPAGRSAFRSKRPCALARNARQPANALPDASLNQLAAATHRRDVLLGALLLQAAGALASPVAAHADDFTTTSSGLKYLDIRLGDGATARPGDRVVVHWAGFTKGYQAKRIDNTSVRDEPYEFVLGQHQAIAAFEEAVTTMQVGGIRRVEVPGAVPGLAYPRDRSERFLPDDLSKGLFKYRYGPQPAELGGQRALDFVLDNPTLQDFNRTLLFDIKLLAVRR